MTEPPLEASRPSEHITWWEEHQNGARLHSIFTRPQYKQLRAVIRIDTGKRRPPDVDIRRSVTQFPPPNAVICTFGQALGCVHSQARPDYPSKTLKTIVAYSPPSLLRNSTKHRIMEHNTIHNPAVLIALPSCPAVFCSGFSLRSLAMASKSSLCFATSRWRYVFSPPDAGRAPREGAASDILSSSSSNSNQHGIACQTHIPHHGQQSYP